MESFTVCCVHFLLIRIIRSSDRVAGSCFAFVSFAMNPTERNGRCKGVEGNAQRQASQFVMFTSYFPRILP
jgi:hypothetical protein